MIRPLTVLAVLGFAAMASAQCADPFDAVLCVYPVTGAPTEIRDNAVSNFWSDWSGKDYMQMIPPDDCYPGRCNFSGESDANIEIKAAGTSRGLYILLTVTDNTWVDRASADDWGADAVDIYFDALDANTAHTCTDCKIGLYTTDLTYTTQQFQVWMGASALPTGCRIAYYDELMWAWTAGYIDWNMLESQYGLQVDVIALSSTQKAQEWFFPWGSYGKKGTILAGTLLDGKKIAFSGGYNDKDGDNVDPDCLRWLGKDPWSGAPDPNNWGDLELQAGMGLVEPVSVKREKHLPVSITTKTMREYYTLQGQRVNLGTLRNVSTRTVLVNRPVNDRASVLVLGR